MADKGAKSGSRNGKSMASGNGDFIKEKRKVNKSQNLQKDEHNGKVSAVLKKRKRVVAEEAPGDAASAGEKAEIDASEVQLTVKKPKSEKNSAKKVAGAQRRREAAVAEKAGTGEERRVEAIGVGGEMFRNKEKVLMVCSRGITYRYRHLMEDLILLLPHCKKDAKMENRKENRAEMLNEMADLKGCSNCIFFEGRKKKDLYMWFSKAPNGPSAKFLVNAVHTMAELKLSGNHLKGSRPILTFSPSFDRIPHLQLLKELFTQIFVTPKDHRKSKPFSDHVIALNYLDNHVWFRNYQIVVPNPSATKLDKVMMDKMTLVEVGPRFCLNPIKIFSGSFGGVTLYENPFYVSPNTVRSQEKRAKSGKYATKIKAKQRRKQHLQTNPRQPDEFADVWQEES